MHPSKPNCVNTQQVDKSVATIHSRKDASNMGKEDRRRIVLSALAETGWAMPPAVVFRNLKLHQNISFEKRSVKTYLSEFVDEGLLRRVDPAHLENRELVDADDDARQAWYIITEEGRDYLRS